jgi:hypothetical protein
MRAAEFDRKATGLPRRYRPCHEGNALSRIGVRRYVATVRVGGQLIKTVVFADSASHAGVLLRHQFGQKGVAAAPVKVDEDRRTSRSSC